MNWLWGTMIAIAATIAPVQTAERITAPVGGISIDMPAGWQSYPVSAAIEGLRALDADTSQARKALAQESSPLLITIGKPSEVDQGVAPSIKIGLISPDGLGGASRAEVLRATLAQWRGKFIDMSELEPPTEIRFAGLPATRARWGFTASISGRPVPLISQSWLISRGGYLILIGAVYGRDIKPGTLAEIQAAVASIVIAPE